MKTKKYVFSTIILIILSLVSSIIIVAVNFKESQFQGVGLEELIFYLTHNIQGANMGPFTTALRNNVLIIMGLTLLFTMPFVVLWSAKLHKLLHLDRSWVRRVFVFLIFLAPIIISMFYANSKLNIIKFIHNRLQSNSFFEDHYVHPENVKITFPEKKRNLIYIYLESIENTLFSQENGGAVSESIMPELEQIALDPSHLTFSHTDKIGGAVETYGTQWTVAALVGQSSGVPLLPLENFTGGFDRNSFGQLDRFLPGAYSLGEILEQASYHNVLMVGSEAEFGGRLNYFKQHGNYTVHDFLSAKEENFIDQDYKVWWGFEDKKLYTFAQEKISELAKSDQPFNFQMLTVDTHFVDGWLDETCPTPYEHKYDNVHACASGQISEFLSWLEKQPFYEDTTIIISGDHLGMQTAYYKDKIGDTDYERSVFNTWINAQAQTDKLKNRRFSTFDYYPTILAALGATVEGDRLGLDTNLFADQSTLFEQYDSDYVNSQLAQRQPYYLKNILSRKD